MNLINSILFIKIEIIIIIILLNLNNKYVKSAQEHLLLRRLLRNYDPSVRPVKDHRLPLNIYFSFMLTQVLELSEKDQVLTTNVWIEQRWKDEYLHWSLDEYPGVKSLRISSPRIWLPDTYIFNIASSKDGMLSTINGPYVMVRNDGLIKFPVLMKLKSNCEIDITYFPFDHQICYIKFASWIHDLAAINLSTFDNRNAYRSNSQPKTLDTKNKNKIAHSESVDLSSYVDNSGWILLNVTLLRRERNHTNGVYPELIYFIHVKRRYLYYIFNVIIPCSMLSLLTCMTFWLPCLSGEKVALGLTCFVAYSVFMLMVAEKVPATSEIIPSIYLTIVMSFTSLSVIMSVIAINVHERTKYCNSKETRLPRMIRHFFLNRLTKLLCMQNDSKKLLKQMSKLHRKNAQKSFSKQSQDEDAAQSGQNTLNKKSEHKNSLFEMIALDLRKRNIEKIKQNFISFNKNEQIRKKSASSHLFKCSQQFDINHDSSLSNCNRLYRTSSTSDLSDTNSISNNNKDIVMLRFKSNTKKSKKFNYKTRISENSSPIWLNRNSSTKRGNSLSTFTFDSDTNRTSDTDHYGTNKIQQQQQATTATSFNNEILNLKNVKNSSSLNNTNANYSKYRIRKENLSLYLSYEWVLFGLVVDRIFFWIYLGSTFLSYFITLYVIPFMFQSTKSDYLKNVP